MASGRFRAFRQAYEPSELFRRYFINTLFDSTFVVLGIVAATALVANFDTHVLLVTLIAAVMSIGISTAASVYEAERLEAQIRMAKIERAMLTDLKDTDVARSLRVFRLLVSLVNFAAPLLVLAVTTLPLALNTVFGVPAKDRAAELSVLLAIALVFVTGFALGRVAKVSPLRQGLRMTIAALATFLLLAFLERYIL